MFYIHQIAALGPVTEKMLWENQIPASEGNRLPAIEPGYENIPRSALRRMAKAVRLSTGAALQILRPEIRIDGIVIGTANGGMEESVKFMNQIMEYEEGMLTPGNFVQSTPNGLAAQIAMFTGNQNYNNTHTHRGLSFENAILDVAMLLAEEPGKTCLLGSADEISSYNFNIDLLAGWYKKETSSPRDLYGSGSPGSLAGEGAAMFIVNSKAGNSILKLSAMETLHSEDAVEVKDWMHSLIGNDPQPDVLLLGDSGDSRFSVFYDACEKISGQRAHVLRYKHLSGEFSTASGIGLYLLCEIARRQEIPSMMLKKKGPDAPFRSFLFYNNYHGYQHSLMWLTRPE